MQLFPFVIRKNIHYAKRSFNFTSYLMNIYTLIKEVTVCLSV